MGCADFWVASLASEGPEGLLPYALCRGRDEAEENLPESAAQPTSATTVTKRADVAECHGTNLPKIVEQLQASDNPGI